MTDKDSTVEGDSKEGQEQTKEEVICPVCSNFEPQAWRKTMCRNCFHPLDDHNKDSEDDGVKSSDIQNKTSGKKDKDVKVDDKSSKGEAPKTLPKSGLAAKSGGLTLNTKKSVDTDKKDKPSTPTGKTPISPSKSATPTGKSPFKQIPGIKDGDKEKGKVASPLASLGSKKQATNEKNVTHDAKSPVKIDNKHDNKKQTEPSALSKWKNNESNVTTSKEKGSSEAKTKDSVDKKKDENKKTADDKSKAEKAADGKGGISLKDTLNKSKAEEISKVKKFSRSFSDTGESDTKKLGGLDRFKNSKENTGTSPSSPIHDNKPGIKHLSQSDATQKQKLGAFTGADKDKRETSATSKESSALSEKVNKFSSLGQDSNKNGTLERRKGSFGKTTKNDRDTPEKGALSTEEKRLDGELEKLTKKLDDMERKCNTLEKENLNLKKGLEVKEQLEGNLQKQKLDVENAIKGLQGQLNSMVSRCSKLETDNTDLLDKLKEQHKLQLEAASKDATSEELKIMEADLNQSEIDIENLQDENEGLKKEIQDLKVEMDEMYDSFREQEAEEFRDLQRELEMTAKNCRVLQFKLRKAERRNEQVESDRLHFEEKLRVLQDQFEDEDARAHIHTIEDELRMAKEVSVRLHDELDILEDKRQKTEEENSHLTRLLEHSDKKQFRLEMEVDKLRDQLADLRKQLAEKSHPGTPSTEDISDRKMLLGFIGKQGSQEQDYSQLMKDLYDVMERETDLKDQLKFTEEENKSMRKKLEELEDENDNLSQQLKKMSKAQATKREDIGGIFGDKQEMSEAESELTVQLELNEKELFLSKKKIQDLENEKDSLNDEIDTLKNLLREKDALLQVLPEPSSPNAFYEEKLKEINYEVDELRWKIIEKDRELETLHAQVNSFQCAQSKLRKSRSLDNDYSQVQVADLKRQVEFLHKENIALKERMLQLQNETTHLESEPVRIQSQVFERSASRRADVNNERENEVEETTEQLEKNAKLISAKESDSECASNEEERTNIGISADVMILQVESRIESGGSEADDKTKTREKSPAKTAKSTGSKADKEGPGMGDSREELMETVLDLEEEIELLTEDLKAKTTDLVSVKEELNQLRSQYEQLKDESSCKQLDLQQEIELSTERNEILSNLLDLVKDRAEAAEAQLEQLAKESATSNDSSQSARIVSTCSDISTGSDDVFAGSPGTSPHQPASPETLSRRQIIQKDWDNQFRKRIECLERLLAEERQKLASAEKKLALVSTVSLSSAMSDDAKLYAREKELLQQEVLEGKKLLKIATDQIKGLRERVFTLEEETQRLKILTNNIQTDSEESESEKTPSYKLDGGDVTYTKIHHAREEEWKTKYSALEKAKTTLEGMHRDLVEEAKSLKGSLKGFKEDVQRKHNQLREIESRISGNSEVVKRKDEIINEQEEIIRQREADLQSLLDQISSRDSDIKDLREKMKKHDEQLKIKEDIVKTLTESVEAKEEEISFLNTELAEMNEKIKVQSEEYKELDRKLSEGSNVTKTEWETENVRLKQELDDLATNMGKLHTDNNTLQVELEKAKQALSEAMVLWNKDRSELEVAHNVAQEKLRIFEEGSGKNEGQIVALLRKETHKLLQSKEKLATDYRVMKVEHEANMRTLKNEKMKLQDELTQKIRQLTAEMTSNDRMSQELDRLKHQEEIAFQIQHNEKVVRAEYLAMKVRYETRVENLQREQLKLLNILDKLQREKNLDQEIIKGVQKGMCTMKETYNQDLARLKDEKGLLESHIKEIEEGKILAEALKKKVDQLKQQLADQEYERAEIIDKITQERATWQVQRAELQSRCNELEEKLSMASYNQSRTKDMQSRMETAWESERNEQRRLLNEAHSLALELQRSIRTREEEFAQERKALLEQMKRMRKELDEEQLGRQEKKDKIDQGGRQIIDLQRKLKEVQDKADKEQEASLKDRADLVRRLAEFRKTHKRDQRRMEDVLTELTRLRELSAILVEAERDGEAADLASRLESFANKDANASGASSASPDLRRASTDITKWINDSLKAIHFAADDLVRPRSRDVNEEEKKSMRRSLSSSELDLLLREDTPVLQQLESMQTTARRRTPTPTQQVQRNLSYRAPGDSRESDSLCASPIPMSQAGSLIDRQHRMMTEVYREEGYSARFPTPPPSLLLPRSRQASHERIVHSTSSLTKTTITKETYTSSSRKAPTSLSLSTSLLHTPHLIPPNKALSKSLSAGSTPADDRTTFSNIPSIHNSDLEVNRTTEKLSPHAARKKFFENSSIQSPVRFHSDEVISHIQSTNSECQKLTCRNN
ncbi:hypothetical protein FSP39_015959 [Pinctada imbricata]|uniref:Uncharacterized protein n=1 Tax=Pinctada imbricata TaxID=66713 RepID=A0AA88XVX3_PINIB|nr:hypothetical protein FSP39_015959 [Pinctada imbricata]